MEYRGHIMIVFALSLMFSPLAIRLVEANFTAQDEAATPAQVVTQAQASAACDRDAIETAIGRLGCTQRDAPTSVRRIDQTMTHQNPARRMEPSGAMFVSAGN